MFSGKLHSNTEDWSWAQCDEHVSIIDNEQKKIAPFCTYVFLYFNFLQFNAALVGIVECIKVKS